MIIEMYTSQNCSFCTSAKALLKQEKLNYREIDVSTDALKASEMIDRSGQRTVPQIFIDGRPVGGFTELAKIHRGGGLV